ncbi:MAG: hypothetical protein SNG35_03475 [Rikenellaceae bacterium]
MRKIIIILTAIVTFSSCFKDEEYNTTLNIKSTEQLESGGEATPLYDVIAYLFEGDLDLTIESYEDAKAGVATDPSGARRAAIASAQSAENYTLLQSNGMEEAFVVVVDTQNQIYTSATLTIGLNLSVTYLSLEFRVWQTKDYTQGKWSFVIPPTVDTGGVDTDIEDTTSGGESL